VGERDHAARFAILKDPRISTTDEDFGAQFALLRELSDSLGALNEAVNRIRRLKRQLTALAERDPGTGGDMSEKAKSAVADLEAIERKLVDVHRESARDTLRNPAGLNDTIIDLLNTVAIADDAPTVPAAEVSRDIMARMTAELGRLDAVVAGSIAEINRLARERSTALVVG